MGYRALPYLIEGGVAASFGFVQDRLGERVPFGCWDGLEICGSTTRPSEARTGQPLKVGARAEESRDSLNSDGIEARDGVRRELDRGRGEVLAQVGQRGRAGNQQDVRRAVEQPSERDLHWGGV